MEERPQADSFVVKIWEKKVEDAAHDASWRGSIAHVESGDRFYLESLADVPCFLAPYVVEAGGELELRTRLYLWITSPRGVLKDRL